jgi:hypothetical protein
MPIHSGILNDCVETVKPRHGNTFLQHAQNRSPRFYTYVNFKVQNRNSWEI